MVEVVVVNKVDLVVSIETEDFRIRGEDEIVDLMELSTGVVSILEEKKVKEEDDKF